MSVNILILDDYLDLFVLVAAKKRHLEILKDLLATGNMPEARWLAALAEATKQKCEEIIQALHANRTTGEVRDLAMTQAAPVRPTEIV